MKRCPAHKMVMTLFLIVLVISGCAPLSTPTGEPPTVVINPSLMPPTVQPTLTPVPLPTATATTPPAYQLWVSPSVPMKIKQAVDLQSVIQPTDELGVYTVRLEPGEPKADEVTLKKSEWVYALVAPFPTISDGYTYDQFLAYWSGKSGGIECSLIMDPSTRLALVSRLGDNAQGVVQEVPSDQLLTIAWQEKNLCAVIPFEELSPRWKVMKIDGVSPYDRQFDPQNYRLTIEFRINGPASSEAALGNSQGNGIPFSFIPPVNRDPELMTTLVMTGVTALVRATAWKMDTLGILFPAETIGDVLRNADITHISNEVPFAPDCPLGDPNTASLRFCSRPEYLQLLESVGADVIELTGNHMNDWGPENFLYTLNLYQERGFKVFAGGKNLEEARQPLLIKDHGNKIAFIGCNPAGPSSDWATETTAGSASCDLDWEAAQINQLRSEGYLPIATFQYDESYTSVPVPWQVKDFRKVSDAGAVIVSGSQAHYPQAFEFTGDNLIHYGLGNLFFDQMNPLINDIRIPGTRWEFIDRHIFYEGRYLGTELVTAMLEDYARPKLMTPEERVSLLQMIFNASGW